MLSRNRWAASALMLLGLFAGACGGGAPEGQDLDVELAPPPAERGVVLEALNAGGYTYARVGAADQELWMAGPMTQLEVGDTLLLRGAENMGSFTSDALDRTFENLYFVGNYVEANLDSRLYQGTVLETMDAAGYTYVQVEVSEDLRWLTAPGSEELVVWLAGPESEIAVGSRLEWQGGSVMRDFHSGTLDRTFPEILFVGGFTTVE